MKSHPANPVHPVKTPWPADALKRLQAGTAAELAALLPSILDEAFKGEL